MKKKIKIDPSKIRDFLTIAMSVVPKKAFAPILETILIDANKDRMIIKGGSFESQVAITIEESFDEEFAICVPAFTFCQTISKLYVGSVTLEYDKGKATIISGKSKYSMPVFPAAEYPIIKLDESGTKITVDGEQFSKMILKAAAFVNDNEAVTTFSSINLIVNDSALKIMACDGSCGGIQSTPSDSNVFTSSLIRKDLYGKLSAMKFSGPATIESDGRNVEIQCANFKINSRLTEDKYADLAHLFTFKQEPHIIVSKIEMVESLRRLSIFTSDISKEVMLDINDGTLILSSENKETGKDASEVLEIENSSVQPIKIKFNITKLTKIIDNVQNEKINIHVTAHNKACFILPESGDNEKWMIMPCI